jgi:hypothetical protein
MEEFPIRQIGVPIREFQSEWSNLSLRSHVTFHQRDQHVLLDAPYTIGVGDRLTIGPAQTVRSKQQEHTGDKGRGERERQRERGTESSFQGSGGTRFLPPRGGLFWHDRIIHWSYTVQCRYSVRHSLRIALPLHALLNSQIHLILRLLTRAFCKIIHKSQCFLISFSNFIFYIQCTYLIMIRVKLLLTGVI